MKCKACEVAENRSLLKVNEVLCNEYNAAIHLEKLKFIQKDEVQGLRSCRKPQFTKGK